ncbi:methyl-accepting chemotaxis protein, partial [Lysobacter sp. D1-1-M9]
MGLQTKLLGALAIGLSLVLVSALLGLGSAWMNLSTEVPVEVTQAADAETIARDFGTQIQEWKNVLIRGDDDELRTRYLAAFNEQDLAVQERALELAEALSDPQAADLVA